MLWLYLALIAYFINAVVFIIDKYLLAAPIPKYHAYTFGVSILSLSAILLIPFGVTWQGASYFFISLISGAAFFVGLLFLYKSIKSSDVSVAATQAGTLGAIFTYIFSIYILKDALSLINSLAFLFLVIGIFFLGKIEKRIFKYAFFSGLFFGFYYVLLKWAFNNSDFINGLFWTRIGFVGTAFISLAFSRVRREIYSSFKNASSRSKALFVFNKFIAGAGFLILYFSIRLGNVSLVNALLGFQFLFTFILVLLIKDRISGVKENMSKEILVNKWTGIVGILIGFLMLFLQR